MDLGFVEEYVWKVTDQKLSQVTVFLLHHLLPDGSFSVSSWQNGDNNIWSYLIWVGGRWSHTAQHGESVSWPGIESVSLAVEAQSPNHWTTKEFLFFVCLNSEAERTQVVWKEKWGKRKVPQLYPTLCDPTDYTVHGILQARILEWVAFPFSRGSSQLRNRAQVSCIADGFFTNWAIREPCGDLNGKEI